MRKLFYVLSITAFSAPPSFTDEPDFVPGRPGNTESPISVPESFWQVETEIASYAHDTADGTAANTWSAAATSIRYGIAHGADVEVIVQPHIHISSEGSVQEGFGDVTLRARKTFIGQDGGPSFALIGYVTLPTSQDRLGAEAVEGGLIATSAFALSSQVNATLTAGVGAVSGDGGEYQVDFYGGANVGYSFTERFNAYVEVFADKTEGASMPAWSLVSPMPPTIAVFSLVGRTGSSMTIPSLSCAT